MQINDHVYRGGVVLIRELSLSADVLTGGMEVARP
jgi:hypothetical protein